VTSLDEALSYQAASIAEKIALCNGFKPSFKGKIEMIIGPMFAGKSTELLRVMQKHE